MTNKKDKGFTLVELLIVIVILGILATVTVFAVRGITDRGQENACSVDQRTLETSIEAFYAQYQRDPTTQAELTGGVSGDEPVLKAAPTNFRFVGANVDPAYSYAANSWNNPTGTAVAAPTLANSAQFVPVDDLGCDA